MDALLMTLNDQLWGKTTEVYNIGSEEQTNVLTVARIVTETMGLKNVKIRATTSPGVRAWPGDVGKMQLDISKIKHLAWKPRLRSEEAVRVAAKELNEELENTH